MSAFAYRITTQGERRRLTVRAFQTGHAQGTFLLKNDGWNEGTGGAPAKAGTYAYAGGEWRNVRSIDPSALAHF